MIPKIYDDLEIISKLSDEPNAQDGLTAAELKAKFDEAAGRLKTFLNDELIPFLASEGATDIGIATIPGVTGAATVQAALEVLKEQMNNLAIGEIPDGSLVTEKYADGSITTVKLADGAVTAEKIMPGGLPTEAIADDAITADKIADSGIATANLADGAITSEKILDGEVKTEDIADLSVTASKLASNSVSSGKIVSSAVTTAKIANAAVTRAKLANDALYSPMAGMSSAAPTRSLYEFAIGTTIRPAGAAVDFTINVTKNDSIPIGAEYAIFRYSAKSLNIVFGDNTKVAIYGEDAFLPSPTITVDTFGMIALKKILADTNNDYWLVTGPAEVVT